MTTAAATERPTSKLTEPRRRGLAVLLRHKQAWRSNETNLDAGYIYWQTADWLIAAGLAEWARADQPYHWLRATDAGRELARRDQA